MHPSRLLIFLFTALFGFFFSKNEAQTPDTLPVTDLKPVTVSAYRLESTDLATPLSLTNIASYRLQNGQQQLALDESLAAVPGVFVQNGTNFAQDVRVSIRGFGSRSAFGIRGIKILVDGFPETSPDGQGQVDNIDPATVTSLSVIRGSTAGLYGNASGGQISFKTLNFKEINHVEMAATAGSFGFQKYQFSGGGKFSKALMAFNSTYTRIDGFREHSAMKNLLLNGGIFLPIDSTFDITIAANYSNSPEAQDAGALTVAEVEADRSAARERNVTFDAGEDLWQGRAGISLTKRFSKKDQINARIFSTQRRFSARLPIVPAEIVELKRFFNGLNINYLHSGRILKLPWELNLGVELEHQNDDRQRYLNEAGKKGSLLLDQRELFTTAGIFLSQKISLTERLQFFPGVRFDAMRLSVEDQFKADGNDSGEKTYAVFNPILGLSYQFALPLNLFANASTGFETPTFTEFANPAGSGGFNPDLNPQKSKNFEIGAKGVLAGGRIKYEAAIFHIRLTDELIPFEDATQGGRTFYRNAGKSVRNGLELGFGSYLGKGFYFYGNYTLSDFRFREYVSGNDDLDGNLLPGVPRRLAYAEFRYFKSSGFHFTQTFQLVDPQYVDDLNTTKTDTYVLANFRAGYRQRFEKWMLEPFLGVNNLFDAGYYANIRINGFGGRYYEPAPGIHFFGGLKVGL
jgi:iron complex outermembrane recepter protein